MLSTPLCRLWSPNSAFRDHQVNTYLIWQKMKYHSLLFLALFTLQPTTSHFMTLEIKNVHHSNPRLNPASNHNNWLRKPQSSCTSHWTTQYYSLAYWLLNLSLFTWLFISQSSFRNKRVLVTRKASERDNEWGCR